MTDAATISLSLTVPLAGAVLISLAGSHPNLRETITILTAVITFFCAVLVARSVLDERVVQLTVAEPIPGIPLAFDAEPLGVVFSLIATFLWIITSIYSIGYMRGHGEKNQTRFYVFFAVAISATLGVAYSANLLTLFICYEILTLATYPLVAHAGTEKAKHGARTYLGILLSTSILFLLLAIAWTWSITGTTDFTPGGILHHNVDRVTGSILLLLFAFGIGKAALMPFHRWLPAAMVAPTPVSALLHAVAVVKAGVFAIVKIAVYIFGTDYLSQLFSSQWLSYIAGFTILSASLVAMQKDNLKARLAYSTVSQLGYISLGAFIATSTGLIGSTMHIVMHAFGKITLFFCAGAIMVASHKTEISEMRGLGRRMPFTMTAFLIGSLSIIGLPPMGGMWSKWYLALGTLEAGELMLLGVLMISSLLNIAYLLPIPIRAFFKDPGAEPAGIKEAPIPCLLALAVTCAGCVGLFFFPDGLYLFAKRVATI